MKSQYTSKQSYSQWSFLIIMTLTLLFFAGCASNPEEEKLNYQKKLESFQVSAYKSAKCVMRASSNIQVETTGVDNLLGVKPNDSGSFGEILKWVKKLDSSVNPEVSLNNVETIDYLRLSKDIWNLQEAMKDSDEDKYPLLLERASGKSTVVQIDSIFRSYGYSYNNSTEHLLFAVIGALSLKTPPEIVFYELSEVEEDELGRNELLLFKQLLQSFYFSLNGLNHMAEENACETVENLEDNKYSTPMLMKTKVNDRQIFQSEEQARISLLSLAYVMRAYTRYVLGGDEKLNQAEEDAIQACELANQSAIQSDELTFLAVLFCIKSDNSEKAKELCNQLLSKSSNESNKQLASKIIAGIENRENNEMTRILEEKNTNNDFIVGILKDYATLTINQNGMLNQNESPEAKNVKAYFSFLEAYTREEKEFSQYADPSFYESKVKELMK